MKSFYDKVRRDEVIGYIFNDVAKVDWAHHIPIICDFWENILFQTNVYKGNPMVTHMRLHALTPLTKSHFDQWQKLFVETVDEHFEGEMAEGLYIFSQGFCLPLMRSLISIPAIVQWVIPFPESPVTM